MNDNNTPQYTMLYIPHIIDPLVHVHVLVNTCTCIHVHVLTEKKSTFRKIKLH